MHSTRSFRENNFSLYEVGKELRTFLCLQVEKLQHCA